MSHYPNISYHPPSPTFSRYPALIYNPLFQSNEPGTCDLVRPQDYAYLPWFGSPMPDFSFAIEPETKERKIDEVLARLKAGVEDIQNSDNFRNFLLTMSKFHDYSIGNTILIMLQFRNATQVAGFTTWKELGRFVKAGEHGIMILAPCLPPKTYSCPFCGQSISGEGQFRQHLIETEHRTDVARIMREAREGGFTGNPNYFKVVYVFDVSQTTGKELPNVEVPVLTTAANETLFTQALELVKVNNLTFTNESRPTQDPGIKGMLSGTTIWVRPEESRAQQLKTLLHELGHFYTERVFMIARADAETIAESSSFVVAAHFGFDTQIRTFGYVAVWSQDKKVLERNLTAIRSVASRMIEALEKITIPSMLRERKEPWQMTQKRFAIEKRIQNLTDFYAPKNASYEDYESARTHSENSVVNQMSTENDLEKHLAIEAISYHHDKLVQKAVKEGKPVPPEVLKDYPELKAEKEENSKSFYKKYHSRQGPAAEAIFNPKKYIGVIYTESGHDYSGPDTNFENIIKDIKGAITNNEYGTPVTKAYVVPFNETTSMPDSDADPIWMYDRDINPLPAS